MTSERSVGERILVIAASTSSASINQALARSVVAELEGDDELTVGLVDLDDYPMPLYQADLERVDGVPKAAQRLAQRIRTAQVLVIVSPEYNRSFPPLLKNTIDWLTRVDRPILTHLTVLLASATPGPGGGRRVLAMVRQWLSSIRVTVAEGELSVPSASLDPHGELDGLDVDELSRFAAEIVKAAAGAAAA